MARITYYIYYYFVKTKRYNPVGSTVYLIFFILVPIQFIIFSLIYKHTDYEFLVLILISMFSFFLIRNYTHKLLANKSYREKYAYIEKKNKLKLLSLVLFVMFVINIVCIYSGLRLMDFFNIYYFTYMKPSWILKLFL
jgi:hypothetical protein